MHNLQLLEYFICNRMQIFTMESQIKITFLPFGVVAGITIYLVYLIQIYTTRDIFYQSIPEQLTKQGDNEGCHIDMEQIERETKTSDIYQEDLLKCSIGVYSNKTKLFNHFRDTNRGKEFCSPSVFSAYFQKHKQFYHDGVWYAPQERSPVYSTFYPETCNFNADLIKQNRFLSCIRQRKYNKIVLSGDSNGFYYFTSLLSIFKDRSMNCELLRSEKGLYPKEFDPYFSVPGMPVIQKQKGCPHCFSQTYLCQGHNDNNNNNTHEAGIVLEFIGMIGIIDNNIVYEASPNHTHVPNRLSFLEHLVLDYFPFHGFPDLWIVSPPFHHEAWHVNYTEHRIHMSTFSQIMRELVPKSTTVLLLTDIRGCPAMQPRWVFEYFINLTDASENKLLYTMNQIMFDAFEPELTDSGSNVLGFLDMGVLSCPFTCVWHLNGVHMVQEWYDRQINFVFEYLCSVNGTKRFK